MACLYILLKYVTLNSRAVNDGKLEIHLQNWDG